MNNKTNKKSTFILILFALLLVIQSAFLVWMAQKSLKTPQVPSGRIVFRDNSPDFRSDPDVEPYLDPDVDPYYLINSDGSGLLFLGGFRGSPAWSPNGELIAINCQYEKDMLCLVNIKDLPDINGYWNEDVYLEYHARRIVQRLTLPEPCIQLNAGDPIISLDWSPDGSQLVMVCFDHNKSVENPSETFISSVCLLALDGTYHCWDEDDARNVKRVEWSPGGDTFLVSDLEKGIALVSLDGAEWQILAAGPDFSSAIWSPDGDQIAYVNDALSGSIIVANPDGSDQLTIETGLTPYRCNELDPGSCRLTWSPDGRYLAYPTSTGGYVFPIVRLDLQTGEYLILAIANPFGRFLTEPDWEPVPPK